MDPNVRPQLERRFVGMLHGESQRLRARLERCCNEWFQCPLAPSDTPETARRMPPTRTVVLIYRQTDKSGHWIFKGLKTL
jgi:hypothetical protein